MIPSSAPLPYGTWLEVRGLFDNDHIDGLKTDALAGYSQM